MAAMMRGGSRILVAAIALVTAFAAAAYAQLQPLDPETLIERYRETWVTGSREMLKLSVLALAERIFDEAAAAAMDERM